MRLLCLLPSSASKDQGGEFLNDNVSREGPQSVQVSLALNLGSDSMIAYHLLAQLACSWNGLMDGRKIDFSNDSCTDAWLELVLRHGRTMTLNFGHGNGLTARRG